MERTSVIDEMADAGRSTAKLAAASVIAGLALIAAALMCGCAGPSKAQYAKLLHECRESNREHLRMLKEYDAQKCDGNPEQSAGAAEMGLGGF